MRRNLEIWLICLSLWALVGSIQISAQDDPNPEANLAVLILVDQSANLFGRAEAGPSDGSNAPSPIDDGAERALDIALHGVEWLMSFQVQQHSVGRSPRIDVAVASFGSSYTEIQDWTRLDAASFAEAETAFQTMKNAIEPQMTTSQGQTDYLDAFQGVTTQMDALNRNSDVADSRRVVIVITDAIPCALERREWSQNDGGCLPGRTEVGSNHIHALEATLQQLVTANTRIELLPLSTDYTTVGAGATSLSAAWNSLVTAEVIATPRPITSSAAIGGEVNNLMFDLLPEGYAIGNEVTSSTLQVDPYLKQMTVTLYKTIDSEHLTLKQPDGTVVKAGAGVRVAGEDMLAEVWTIDDPVPGVWTVTGGGSIYAANSPVTASFDIQQGRSAYQKVNIDLNLSATGKLPTYSSAFTLKGNLTIRPEGGQAQTVQLIPDPSDPGHFTASYIPLRAVAHTVTLDVNAGDKHLPDSFSTVNDSFTVSPVTVFIHGIDDDKKPLRGEPRTFQLQLLDTNTHQPISDVSVAEFNLTFPPVDSACPTNAVTTASDGSVVVSPQLNPSEPDTWTMTHTFTAAGTVQACPLVKITDVASSGSPLTIRDYSSAVTLNVEAENKVLLTLRMDDKSEEAVASSSNSSTQGRTEFHYTNPVFALESFLVLPQPTVIVRAYVVDDTGVRGDGAPIATQLLEAGENPDDYLCLSITGEGKNLLKEKQIKLTRTPDPSEWRVLLGTLPAGTYTMRVVAYDIPKTEESIASLTTDSSCDDRTWALDTGRIGKNNYRFDPRAEVLATLVVVTDFMPLYVAIGIGILGITAVYGFIVRPLQKRASPLKGSLRIFRDDETEPIFSIPLQKYGLNTVKVAANHLPIVEPPIVQMTVTNLKNGQIRVNYAFDPTQPKTDEMILNQRFVLPYSSWHGRRYTMVWVESKN